MSSLLLLPFYVPYFFKLVFSVFSLLASCCVRLSVPLHSDTYPVWIIGQHCLHSECRMSSCTFRSTQVQTHSQWQKLLSTWQDTSSQHPQSEVKILEISSNFHFPNFSSKHRSAGMSLRHHRYSRTGGHLGAVKAIETLQAHYLAPLMCDVVYINRLNITRRF